MRRYEVVFVLAPTLGEEEVKTQIETFSTVAQEKGAEVLEVEVLDPTAHLSRLRSRAEPVLEGFAP